MTHFGENTEFIEDDPVNLMLPSDLTKTVSIQNYGPPKFQSYENFTSQTQGKSLVIEDDPVDHMLPSDSTETVSILNYGPPKFQS